MRGAGQGADGTEIPPVEGEHGVRLVLFGQGGVVGHASHCERDAFVQRVTSSPRFQRPVRSPHGRPVMISHRVTNGEGGPANLPADSRT
jgi:hypothetical protein